MKVFKFRFGFVSDILGPGVNGGSPRASGFNTKVINTSDDSNVSFFTPIGSPRISNNPIFDTIFFSPTDNTNVMIEFFSAGFVFENTTSVVNKILSNSDSACDGTSLVNLVDHVLFTRNISELIN